MPFGKIFRLRIAVCFENVNGLCLNSCRCYTCAVRFFPRTVTIWVPKGHFLNNLFLLRTCQTQKDFAKVLGYSEKEFTFILFSQSIQNKYQSFDIPKKNGNKRKILAPTPDLKILQTRLSTLLTNCYEELEKKRLSKSSYVQCISSHGFRKKLLLDIPFTKKISYTFWKKSN